MLYKHATLTTVGIIKVGRKILFRYDLRLLRIVTQSGENNANKTA